MARDVGDTAPSRTVGRGAAAEVRTLRWPVVLLALVAAAVVLLAGGRVWASGQVDGLSGLVRVSVTGREARPLVVALGLISAAAGVVLAICGPVLRWLAAVALVLSGAGVVLTASARVGQAATLLEPAAARVSGVAGSTVRAAELSGWPWLAVGGGVLAVLAGLGAILAGPAWASTGRRYERSAAPAGPADLSGQPGAAVQEDPLSAWEALSRGEDPTAPNQGG